MPQQPNLFSPPPGEPDQATRTTHNHAPRKQTARTDSRWLVRTELLVRVIVRLYLGLLVTVLPWMRFWVENGLFSYSRGTAFLASSGFLRGLVSGLGLLNVAIAFKELFPPKREP